MIQTATRPIRSAPARRAAALALLSAVVLTAACRDEGERSTAQAAPAAAVASLDPRSQYDLARALGEVETARDPDLVALGYERIRSSWTGRRYRWRVRVLEPLCRARDACNVLPFDRAGRDRGIVHGWMPRLVLDDAAFSAIQRTCAGRPSCEVDLEGTLGRFVIDSQNPTSLEFTRVRVL